MERPALLEMQNITKEFPGVKALDNVSLTVRPGTVHALMGENGAGKSTLMKCLFGIYAKDSGTIVTGRIAGTPVRILKNQMARTYVSKERAGATMMELEQYTLGSLRRAVFDGDTKTGSLMAGQVAGMLHEIKPLRQIFEELSAGCDRRLAELRG